ncbi:MAG: DEAD/DEAH box helicase family protein, partial [Actinomycetota bacterium]|nr:DEAD/DEAH box helicase family protein [Actinomycetota bacterium]
MKPHILLPLDEAAIAEIAANLDLRKANRQALAAAAKRFDAAAGEPVEIVLDLATAVGKTYVAAAIIDYCAAQGASNFVIVTPSRTILSKTINNFTPGHPKEVRGRSTSPLLVTTEDFANGAVKAALGDTSTVKLFVFTVQQLIRPNDKTSRRVRDFQEGLGQGLYDYLRSVGDLVVLADEHHSYFGARFSEAVRDLDAAVLVGLTATVAPKTPPEQIAFRYTLGEAIADEIVKVPVLVGRDDDRTDIETQLRDGVALLDAKAGAVAKYCTVSGVAPVNPVMFVICQSIEDANEVAEVLRRPGLFPENYAEAVLTVHSDAGDEVLEELGKVEDPTSPVRVIVSVSMLKEGWDVKNIFVICALRALASQVLTEQTLGRGLRLPFGTRTGVEMLDTLELLAHDRYRDLLARADSLVASLITDRTSGVADPVTGVAPVDAAVPAAGTAWPQASGDPEARSETRSISGTVPGVTGTVVRIAEIGHRKAEMERETSAINQIISIRGDVEPFYVPVIKTVPKPRHFSLSVIDDSDFESLGQSLAANPEETLRRSKLEVVVTASGALSVRPVPATDKVQATLPELDLGAGEEALVAAILNLGQVRQSAAEKNAATRLVEAFVRGLGDDAARRLSAFFNTALDAISKAIDIRYRKTPSDDEVKVEERQLEVRRLNDRLTTMNIHEHVDHNHPVAYEGWTKSLVAIEWFDSDTERQMAVLLDESAKIKRWIRLHRSDGVNIAYHGRSYYPDFAA